MSGSIDPTLRSTHATKAPVHAQAPPQSSPDLCGWCFGAGKYLEAMDCGVEHVYLPVVCDGCGGTGRSALPH